MSEKAINLGGRPLGRVRHICAFFHSKEEEYRTLIDFIKEGLEQNERAVHIVDIKARDQHLKRLESEGIPVDEARQQRKLEVICWEDAYLKDGYFDQDRQLRLLEGILTDGHQRGFRMTRLVANMEWALEDKSGVEDIVAYESRLNHILPQYEDPVICTYDLSRFSAGIAMDILRTHPAVLIGGVLQENPFYIPPDEFLKELHARG